MNSGKHMHTIFRYRKFIGLTLVISIFFLTFPSSSARAVMITTEDLIHQNPDRFSDRARVKAFLGRADVMSQMQAYGINHQEALSRVDSLTDSEIASIADRMDQLPAGAYALDGGILTILGIALYAFIAAILIYFSSTDDTEKKP